MADADDAYSPLDVVPYDSHREIVFRYNDAVVVYDPSSRQLVLQNSPTSELNHASCPTCNRPWQRQNGQARPETPVESDSGTEGGFRTPDYFHLLQQGYQDSTAPSGPSSPRRRLVQPGRRASGRTASLRPSGASDSTSDVSASVEESHGIASSAYSQGFLESHFPVVRKLGEGGRGVVFLVEHVLNGIPLGYHACKRIPVGDDQKWLKKVLHEVQLLARLHHQNLVAYQHVWLETTTITNFGPPVPCAYILQEYCDGGDLQNYVVGSAPVTITAEQLKDRMRRRSKGSLEPSELMSNVRTLHFDEIYSFFRDMTAGIQFLHDHGYIHRDLKPSNCLLRHNDRGGFTVLVSDFGEAQEQNVTRKSTGATGTVSYCAPEVLKRTRPDGPYGNFTEKSDIFSLGMILYFLCFASLPYKNANILNEESEDLDSLRIEVMQWAGFNEARRLRPELPDELYFLLKRLLSTNAENRPTADEVISAIQKRSSHGESKLPRRPHTPPQPFEDLSSHRRIVPIDSPAPDSPKPTSTSNPTSSSTAVSKVRPSRLRTATSLETSAKTTSSDNYTEHSQSPHRELILRRPQASPDRQEQQSPERGRNTGPAFLQTYLLEAGSPAGTRLTIRLGNYMQLPQIRRLCSFVLVSLKVLSILQPCTSRGMNPMATYPLLLLALWDFGYGGRNYPFSIITLAIHCVVLGISLRSNTLCAGPIGEVTWVDERTD